MGRIRTIKPEFFSHEQLASKSAHARLLAIGLLTMADCEGRLRWVPMQVHAQVFPWEASVKIQVLLGELIECGYVLHYEADGKQFLEIVNFRKHQRLSGKEATYKSLCPPPPKNGKKPNENKGTNVEALGKHPDTSLGSGGNPLGTGEQGNRGTGEQGNTHTHTQANVPKGFEDCWRKWEAFVLERTGRRIGPVEAEAHLADLMDRGPEKAARDVEFTILRSKNCQRILDSDNDFEKQKQAGKASPPGKQQPKAEGALY